MACANLGVANDFSIFVLGDHTQSFVDSGGRIAVGGNATYRSYGIGSSLSVSTTRADLIVGGNMDIISGSNFSGNSVISPSGSIINYTMTNNNGVRPQPQRGTLVDFAAAGQYLTCASSSWGALTPTGTASVNFGQIVLTGTSPTLNIFSINGNNVAGSGVSLSSANGINLITPAGSTVLVNIAGTSVGFGSYTIFINGNSPSPSNGTVILWNFYQATTAFNLNLSIKGSVLAPNAIWSAIGFGNIDGTMAAQSFVNTTGTLEAHNVPFGGCLPEVFCTPQLTVSKTINGAKSFSGPAATPLTYVIDVTNTGSGTLTSVLVNDPLLSFSQTIPQLLAGQGISFTLQSEVQSGTPNSTYPNTVTAQSDQTPQQSDSVTITIIGVVNVSLRKTADRMSAMPGEIVNYQFVVENPGQVALQNVTLTDSALGISLSFPTFLSGTIATFPYTIPANTLIGSTIVNTAVLNASNLTQPVSAQASVLVTETPTVSLSKQADRKTALPGDTIDYTITIMNDSIATTLFNLHLTDPLLLLDQVITQLNPQASVIFNGMYTVPQGTASGTVITNTTVLQSSLGTQSATAQVTVASAPSVAIAKTPRQSEVSPGETVTYDIVVTNDGNVPLTNVKVSDPTLSFSATIPSLAIGALFPAEAFFTVPLNTPAGTRIFNTATVITNQTPSRLASNEIIVLPTFSLSLQKSVSEQTAVPLQLVTYTITVSNTSNAPITNVNVSDPTLGFEQFIATLSQGGITIYEIPFIIPEGTTAGTTLANQVSAFSDQTLLTTADAVVTIDSAPGLTLTKSVLPDSALPGEVVTYTLTLQNTGNVDLTDIRLIDSALGLDTTLPSLLINSSTEITVPFTVPAALPDTIVINTAVASSTQIPTPIEASAAFVVGTAPSITLTKTVSAPFAVPGQTITFFVSLTNASAITLTNVRIEDDFFNLTDTFPELLPGETRTFNLQVMVPVDSPAGTVILNRITAISDQTPSVSAEAQSTVIAVPGLSISKTADLPSAEPGQSVSYRIIVTNTGNTELNNVTVTDASISLTALVPSLPQGASQTFLVPFAIPKDALPDTLFINTAVAQSEQTGPASSQAETLILPLPSNSIAVQKIVDSLSASPGTTVTYTIIVSNNSQASLTQVTVSDPTLGIQESLTLLEAGSNLTITVPYLIPVGTPAGTELTNVVSAAASGSSATATATVIVLAEPSLAITKTADQLSPMPGNTVQYTITVTNTGNTPLTNVVVADASLGFSTTYPSLAIGESQSSVVPFLVPVAPPGTIITNTSTAVSAQTPSPAEASAAISIGAPAALTLLKSVSPAEAAPGETVVFTLAVTNTSAISLTNVRVSDSLLGLLENVPTLPAGTSKSIVTNYVVPPLTPAGTLITNTATAVSDQTLPSLSNASFLVASAPSLLLRKVEESTFLQPGERQRYLIFLTNSGNVPLTGITLRDPLIGLNETISVLNPQTTLVFSSDFQVPVGLRAGSKIFNTATATSNQTPPQEAMTNLTIAPSYSIGVTKFAASDRVQPGSSITFSTTITNNSNDTLTNISIFDSLIQLSEEVSSLPAGSAITITSSVPVEATTPFNTLITNKVTVASTQTAPVSAESSVIVLSGPRLALTKHFPSIGLRGQRVPVSLAFANTGNIRLNNIHLTDGLDQLNIRIADLLPGASQIVNELYPIPENAILGSVITNQAIIESDETAPFSAIKELTVVGLVVEKSVNASHIGVNDILVFHVKVTNPTKLPASQVVVTDPLASGTSLVAGSVSLNGSKLPDAQPASGIAVGTLLPGASAYLIFRIRLDTEQPDDRLTNQAYASFVFVADIELRGVAASNPVVVEVLEEEE